MKITGYFYKVMLIMEQTHRPVLVVPEIRVLLGDQPLLYLREVRHFQGHLVIQVDRQGQCHPFVLKNPIYRTESLWYNNVLFFGKLYPFYFINLFSNSNTASCIEYFNELKNSIESTQLLVHVTIFLLTWFTTAALLSRDSRESPLTLHSLQSGKSRISISSRFSRNSHKTWLSLRT